MNVAGFVLAGGKSSRMGSDKALLRKDGIATLERIAALVRQTAGNVFIVGDPGKYGALGLPVIPDIRPGEGPLAGFEAALTGSRSEWNIIVACDLVSLTAAFLGALRDEALRLPPDIDCAIPVAPDGRWQPLGGIYRRRCLGAFSAALDRGQRKVASAVESLNAHFMRNADARVFQNVNTPEEWNRYLNGRAE